MLRPVLRALGVFLGLVVLGFAAVFGLSEWKLRSFTDPPVLSVPIPDDSASLALGRHLTRTRGCFGCHGQQLEGRSFEDEWPWVRRAVAPNLARHAREHPPETLARAIRGGVGHDGRALWSMPSYNFKHLTDDEVAALIGFLRAADVVDGEPLPRPSLGWRARWALASGAESHMAQWGDEVPDLVLGSGDDPALARGERLAMTSCNECHGLDLRGSWVEMDIAPPDLAIVAGYPWDDFQTLMKTGVPLDGRDLGLMGVVARDRFASFTEQELDELYRFLQTLPGRPIPEGVFWRPER